jgi:histidinol-phosphatase
MSDDLDLALRLADLADAQTLAGFRDPALQVEMKADHTPVTGIDRGVERAIREALAVERPDDRVVGEEFGGTEETASRRWIVDPIDGTKNFVRGIPIFATLIALEQEGELTMGVASAPALGRRWWAERGGGAFADGRPIHVSAVDRVEDAHLCYTSVAGWEERGLGDRFLALTRRCGRTRGLGDFYQHVLVAEGAADLAVEPDVALWDLAALLVIVEEAGGRFTNLSGRRTAAGGSAVSSNGLLHDEVLAALRA